MRVGVYLRVSTLDQSTEAQKRDLLAYIEARGWRNEAIFEDKATGMNSNRPGFKELMTAVRQRKVDVVLVWSLSRVGRSLKDLVLTLQEITELGVGFVSLKESLDLTTSTGRLMAGILSCFAAWEGDVIRERVRAGVANARAKGKRLGRPKVRDDEVIRALRAQGLSIRQIAAQAGTSTTSVQRALSVNKSSQGTAGRSSA